MRWKDHPARSALFSLYADADALVAGAACACTPGSDIAPGEELAGTLEGAERVPCCHFGVTGREPYPTAVELAEVEYALERRGQRKRQPRRLPLVDETRSCPLLSDGLCTIYASRPLGCRTFFCDRGEGLPKRVRQPLLEIARRMADLSAKAFPRDPRPRPLTGALKRMT